MAERVYDLGPGGEEVAERLLSTIRLTEHLEPTFVLAKFPAALGELRRRVQAAAGKFWRLEPGRNVAERIDDFARYDTDGSPGRRVLWVEAQEKFDLQGWKETLAIFNQRREWLAERAPWLIILAGPLEDKAENHLRYLAGEHAPDLLSIANTHLIQEEPKLLPPPPARPIRWLHLSDFHFASLEGWDRRRTLKALLEFLGDRKAAGWRPDFVFATGDIAWSGQLKEYDQAYLFFSELGKLLELDLPKQLFLIPGNHDVDRKAIGPADEFILKGLLADQGTEQQEQIAKTLADSATMKLLGRRLSEYYAFTERLRGPARRVQEDKPWRVDFADVAGVEVAILQLNTACFSGPGDKEAGLILGLHQLEDALREASRSRLRIVLQHHPFNFLFDGSEVKDRMRWPDGAHFVLRGHLHKNEADFSANPDGELIELAAGAVYAGTKWPKRFLLGEADLEKGQATIEFWTYSEGGFWVPDNTPYRKLKEGRCTVALPSVLRLAEEGKGITATETVARQRTVAARYRAAVVAVYGQMRFIGIPAAAGGSRRDVEVHELFVPLRLAVAGQREDRSLATSDLLEKLAPGRAKPWRFVVLGEPGAGKTTLCKYAAGFFAGDRGPRAGTDQGGRTQGSAPSGRSEPVAAEVVEVIPLFLPFREYVRHCLEAGDCGLLDFLVEEARKHLSVGSVDAKWLDTVLDAGDAVLLLDGLDEVGSAEERAKMRERVLGFCSQYPKLPVLLTSRFAGYDETPLPQSFVRLELKPFEDEDLQSFVRAWYTLQEKNDPVARERGIVDLLAAIEAEPRVRALAGNPLLATLIALVHRSEARLPGERAKLYELVVRTLLETWPNQSGRKFTEIDEGLQRSFLETFALQQQEKRSRSDAEVNFQREDLVTALSAIVGQREPGPSSEQVRRKVERWVAYLAAGTGIIVEQQVGSFAFLHLSLLEYLAAAALDQQREAIADRIARLRNMEVWREVLLLVVGRHATDLPFLERVFAILSAAKDWEFLLLCLQEEAAFDALEIGTILSAVGKGLLAKLPYEWGTSQAVVQTIERFSPRHRTAVRSWRLSQLAHAVGEDLAAAVALSFGQREGLLEALDSRKDQAVAAAGLLEFWPGSFAGEWAATWAAGDQALRSLESLPVDLAIVRTLGALRSSAVSRGLLAAVVSHQLRTNIDFGTLATKAAAELIKLERQDGANGLPRCIMVQSTDVVLKVLPALFQNLSRPQVSLNFEASRHFASYFALGSAREFDLGWARFSTLGFSLDFPPLLVRHLFRKLDRYVAPDFIRYFALDFVREFTRFFGGGFGREVDRKFARNFVLETTECHHRTAARPDEYATCADRKALEEFEAEQNARTEGLAFEAISLRFIAESWVALVTTSLYSHMEAKAYLAYRLQNASLLYLWPVLDAKLAVNPDPARLALYLQLGWTQSTTTHEWPGTERWIALMKADPPAHWWPRAHWHLCWLLHDTAGNPDHQKGFNAALNEGLSDPDPDHLRVAETLKELIGFF